MPPKKPPASVKEGDACMVAVCSWCGSPAPIHNDRRGNPFCKCVACGSRSFGNQAAYALGEQHSRFVEVVWPPDNLFRGVAFNG